MLCPSIIQDSRYFIRKILWKKTGYALGTFYSSPKTSQHTCANMGNTEIRQFSFRGNSANKVSVHQWYWMLCLLTFTLGLRKTSARRQSDEGCATSQGLKWGPLPPNYIGRTTQPFREGGGRRKGWRGLVTRKVWEVGVT